MLRPRRLWGRLVPRIRHDAASSVTEAWVAQAPWALRDPFKGALRVLLRAPLRDL